MWLKKGGPKNKRGLFWGALAALALSSLFSAACSPREERIVYIYGGLDPWTAAAVQPGANHGVSIGGLDQKELVIQTLERWLNIQIDRSVLAAWKAPLEKVRL